MAAPEKLLHHRSLPLLEVPRTVQSENFVPRTVIGSRLQNPGGKALTCVVLGGAILPEPQLTLNVTASPSVARALTRWLLALRTLQLSLLGPLSHQPLLEMWNRLALRHLGRIKTGSQTSNTSM